jgi:hypothetical protein
MLVVKVKLIQLVAIIGNIFRSLPQNRKEALLRPLFFVYNE